jgi:hypothetical protein
MRCPRPIRAIRTPTSSAEATEASVERAVAAHELQILREKEQQTAQREDGEEVGGYGARERRAAKQSDVNKWMHKSLLTADEQYEGGHPDDAPHSGPDAGMATGQILDRVDDRHDSRQRERGTEQIEGAGV